MKGLAWIDSEWPLRTGAGGVYYSADLDWLSGHRGGWQEMFPNAGAGCTIDGVFHPVHGDPPQVNRGGSNPP